METACTAKITTVQELPSAEIVAEVCLNHYGHVSPTHDGVEMEMEAQSDGYLIREMEVMTRIQEQMEKKKKREVDDSIWYKEEMKLQPEAG